MKIIIVDDDQAIVKFLEIYLIKRNFEVVGKAYNGKKAMELMEKLEFDGLVVDYYLPDMTGVDVAKYALKIRKNIKVVIITASEGVAVKDFPVVRKKTNNFKDIILHLSS